MGGIPTGRGQSALTKRQVVNSAPRGLARCGLSGKAREVDAAAERVAANDRAVLRTRHRDAKLALLIHDLKAQIVLFFAFVAAARFSLVLLAETTGIFVFPHPATGVRDTAQNHRMTS